MINMHPPKFLGVLQAWVNVPVCFSLAGEQVKNALGLLCLVITVVCLFHINEGKHGIFVLLYDGEVGESK